MPLYEYRCEACGATEETLESFSAPTEHACAKCQEPQGMKRQVSRTAFVLSGDGWYASGYGATPAAPAKESPAKDAPKAESQPAGPAPETPKAPVAPSEG